jgi:hypothetical protein
MSNVEPENGTEEVELEAFDPAVVKPRYRSVVENCVRGIPGSA